MDAAVKKASGSFFTPPKLARLLGQWAIRSPQDRVLEPSCGDGVFVEAAATRLRDLGAAPRHVRDSLVAVEKRVEQIKIPKDLEHCVSEPIRADFFEVACETSPRLAAHRLRCFDAVLGNPPYVRYQLFSGAPRDLAHDCAKDQGVVLPNLASMWAPFLVHASSFVAANGRLAMVLPGELLHVKYAGPLRAFLLRDFQRICVIKFEKKIFPGALEEVVLLLAERKSINAGLHIAHVQDIEDLTARFEEVISGPGRAVTTVSEKWNSFLLKDQAYRAFHSFTERPDFTRLGDIASVDIGVVTGANDFFFLSPSETKILGVSSRYLKPAISRAAHVAGCQFSASALYELEKSDAKCQLLLIDEEAIRADGALRDYIARGEKAGLHKRYKCRSRSPWYQLKCPTPPDAFLCYMANVIPRLSNNTAEAVNSNTVHGVRFKHRVISFIRAQVVSFYNSVTLLSCELFARSYGGGVLKIEPSEAESLLVPRLESTRLVNALDRMFPEIDDLIRNGQIAEAVGRVDSVLLRKSFRTSATRLASISNSLHQLRERRLARSTG